MRPSLVAANTYVLDGAGADAARVEFGYPSECEHVLHEAPFLGFPGALALSTRLANEMVKGFYRRRGKP